MVKFIDLYSQYQTIKHEIDQAIDSTILYSSFIGGKSVADFEEEFAHYLSVDNCIGVGNGTDAIEIALASLDLPSGSKVVVPANSFIATAEAVTREGHEAVFCDCNEDDYTIDVDHLNSIVDKSTNVIIPVHLYGHPCDMNRIMSIAKKNNAYVIEDCAQAHGAEYMGKKVGSFGDLATFSFYPGKVLGGYGDGGAVVTSSKTRANIVRMISNHGRLEKFGHKIVGRNSRLDGIQAAVLRVKLQHLNDWIDIRERIAQEYIKLLDQYDDVVTPVIRDWAKSAWHLFVIRVPNRDKVRLAMSNDLIETGIHYPITINATDAYGRPGVAPVAESISEDLLSLPIGEHMNIKMVKESVDSLRRALDE